MTRVVEPTGPSWPPAPSARLVVLARTRSRAETAVVAQWATTLGASLETDAAAAVAQGEDVLLVPVRVSRSADTSGRALLVGEPGTVAELRARWTERSVGGDGFADFVLRQADIALERSLRAVRGDRYRSPRAVVDEVISHRDFVRRAEELARRLGRTPEGVLSDCRAYLEEMASEERRAAIDVWARFARFLHGRAYAVKVDQDQVARLRELSASHPLVFLPSHRSNLDPYVMTTVTHENGLPLNHVLGGINMAFWPLGPLARRVGMVFIRRSFRDNEVYRFVLASYLGFLVSKRFNLEWYLEGGRSRTGKLLPPKLGLLNYLADAVEDRGLKDVLVVPTAIVYDLLHEAGEMTSESRGAVKQAEGLRWLVHFVRTQRRQMGSAHVRFGEPINLHDLLTSLQEEQGSTPRLARSKVAFEVSTRINRATTATAPALVSFALLGVGDRSLTVGQVARVLAPVLDYIAVREVPVAEAARELATPQGLQQTLDVLVDHGVVARYDGGPETVYGIGEEQELVAAFYRNATVHWFVNRAIVELSMLRAAALGPGETVEDVAWQEAFRLRDLLKFEFFFSDKDAFRAELAEEVALIEPEWRSRRGAVHEIVPALQREGALVAHRVLRSFVEAYAVVADALVALGSREADAERVVTYSLGLGQQYRRQRRVTSAEAVSSHLFRTCLKLAANRDLLAARPGVEADRVAFAAELHDVLARLAEITRVDHERLTGELL